MIEKKHNPNLPKLLTQWLKFPSLRKKKIHVLELVTTCLQIMLKYKCLWENRQVYFHHLNFGDRRVSHKISGCSRRQRERSGRDKTLHRGWSRCSITAQGWESHLAALRLFRSKKEQCVGRLIVYTLNVNFWLLYGLQFAWGLLALNQPDSS